MMQKTDDSESAAAATPGTSRRWRILGWGTAGVLWLTPLIAMQFTGEVRWTPGDFVVFGAMLLLAGTGLEWVFRARRNIAWRLGAGLALSIGFGLLWAQGAVGLVGDGNNLASVAVLAFAALTIAAGLYALGKRGARTSGQAG